MAEPLDPTVRRARRASVAPTQMSGAPGVAIHGGYVEEHEKNRALQGAEKYRTYSEILANTSIAAASVRYFLNLAAKASWKFEPSEADADGRFAEMAEAALTEDPLTSWARVIRRACMYRFYGFGIQEWKMRRHLDGHFTYDDVAPRAQKTIEKWDVDVDGAVLGVVQTSPQTQRDLYIDRRKVLYLVDDTLSDSPEGLGLFRHLVSPSSRLARYEQLEGFGFETDLRGIPKGRAPLTYLKELENEGTISKADRVALEKPLRDFIKGHVRAPNLGLLLDSMTYQTEDEAATPSDVYQWDVELVQGSSNSFKENAAAIERLNREIARILGTEHLLLGSTSAGSFALGSTKMGSFFLLVMATLSEVAEQVEADLLGPLWALNGWPEEMRPRAVPEELRMIDVEQVASALRDMSTAGAMLDERDPVVDEVRMQLGVSPRPPELMQEIEDMAEVKREAAEAGLQREIDGPEDPKGGLPAQRPGQGGNGDGG